MSNILVVDDEPDNYDVIETLLSDQDHTLQYASNGEEAIDYLDAYNPDLILLDVMMPGTSGIEICRKIKSNPLWETIPIVMVTALTTKSDMANCLAAGADDFIGKPVNGTELKARVNSMLRIRHQFVKIKKLYEIQESTIELLQNTLQELQGGLAQRLSHELRTPLNGIVGTVSLLKADLENLDTEEIRELISWIDESAIRLENLTQKFLIFIQLDILASKGEKIIGTRQKLNLPKLLSTLSTIANNYGRAADLNIELHADESSVFEDYLVIILNELLENACKFSNKGSTITILTTVINSFFVIKVHNFGIGFTDRQLENINAFMQFNRNKQEQQGMGLGLKTVNKIVELAGGEIRILSTYQQETTIEVLLPLGTE